MGFITTTTTSLYLYTFEAFWPSLIAMISSFIMIKTLISYLLKKSHDKKPKLPPGPKPWPIVGNLPEMLSNKPEYQWIHKLMQDMNTEIACIRLLGNVHVIPVSCPNLALEFLRKHDAVFASRPKNIFSDLVSGGYLTTVLVPFGEQFKKMKKILVNELLSPKRHQWFQDKRDQEANNLMFYVYNESKNNNNNNVNVRVATQHYCCNVIRKMIFNKRYFGDGRNNINIIEGGPGLEEVEYVDAVFCLVFHVFRFCVSDYFPWLRGLDLDGQESKVKEALRIVKKYHDPIIEERIKQWNDGFKSEQEDFLDVLISLKDPNNKPFLTPEEIKAQIIELMIAVVDNPSNAAEWALAEMINQPELLQRATEEVDNVVGRERMVQESDIPKLNYIKACLREAFRLHPIVTFNAPHVSMEDTIIGGEYLIPKGSLVLLDRHLLGRNPKIWNEPHKFDPQRHLINSKGRDKVILTEPDLRFVSFSIGRRGCPGVTLGTTMVVMLFARLIHGFTWSLPHGVSKIDLALSRNGMLLAEPLVAIAKPRLEAGLYQLN
ncbi:hypothetical protein PIB30_026769 [Stylosanthes scabra]|uniref:Cytochrome P450 n=1 Tax=Stylosanthes scabra TaxID=79078 RepID=A0ABU6X8P2_9FABA|nr:hypothetical protein [Stylosanthes scabra]